VLGFPSGTVLWNFQLRTFSGILPSSVLIIIWRAHPSLIILISCPRYSYVGINYKFHYSLWDGSVLYIVLGHKFFSTFFFRMYIAFLLSFVFESRVHVHNTVVASLMFYIILFYYFGGFVYISIQFAESNKLY
jgi:hypothetical protein